MEINHLNASFDIGKHFGKDLNKVIDCSMQGKDFVSDLKAEIDLDESSDLPVLEEKGVAEDKGKQELEVNIQDHDNTENVLNKSDNTENVNNDSENAENRRKESYNSEIVIKDGDNTDQVTEKENCASNSGVKEKLENINGELQGTGEIQNVGLELGNSDMGNTMDNSNRMESNVDGDLGAQVKDTVNMSNLSNEVSDSSDVPDRREEVSPVETGAPDGENSSDGKEKHVDEVLLEENKRADKNETKGNPNENALQIVEADSKEPAITCEGLHESPRVLENAGDKPVESQDVCDKMEQAQIVESENTDIGVTIYTDTHVEKEENKEPAEELQDEVDRAEVKSFIEEVINNMRIPTEECDRTVQELGIESVVGDLNTERDGTYEANSISDDSENVLLGTENMCDKNEDTESADSSADPVEKENESKLECENENENQRADKHIPNRSVLEISEVIGFENGQSGMDDCHKKELHENKNDLQENQESNDQMTATDSKQRNIGIKTEPKMSQSSKDRSSKDVKNIAMSDQELQEAQSALHAAQCSLKDERAKHIREVMKLKLTLYRTQMDLKAQKAESEKQLTEVISQLVMLESRLRREQKKVKLEIRQKNDTIETQRNEILKLKEQNTQLYNAIKEICANGGMNGYMRDKRKNGSCSDGFDSGAKGRGKLGTMKDKFMAKNRSSMELSSINLEKYLIKNERMCSSQEDLQRAVEDERRRSIPNGDQRLSLSPKETVRPVSDGIEYKNGKYRKNVKYHHQNFFNDSGSPDYEMNKSVSESSHLSESTNSSSGVYSQSEHDLSAQDVLNTNNYSYNNEEPDDDEDDRIFSFSSTHINTVINEEEALGSGHMTSMGSMPMLAHIHQEHRLGTGKDRPHSLSSVDIHSIQQQAKNVPKNVHKSMPVPIPSPEMSTPPASPSYHTKELTPFQTFKTMFRRSKNKGNKKRSVSLSQTTNTEYQEAMRKHFQKYDMQ